MHFKVYMVSYISLGTAMVKNGKLLPLCHFILVFFQHALVLKDFPNGCVLEAF